MTGFQQLIVNNLWLNINELMELLTLTDTANCLKILNNIPKSLTKQLTSSLQLL